MQETRVRSLGWEDPLEKEMSTHSSILAWKIPWTEELGRLQSMGSQTVRHDWTTSLFTGTKIPQATQYKQLPCHQKRKNPYSIYCGWPFLQDLSKHPTTNAKWPRSDATSFPSFIKPYNNSNLFRKSHSWSVPTSSCRQKSETPATDFFKSLNPKWNVICH